MVRSAELLPGTGRVAGVGPRAGRRPGARPTTAPGTPRGSGCSSTAGTPSTGRSWRTCWRSDGRPDRTASAERRAGTRRSGRAVCDARDVRVPDVRGPVRRLDAGAGGALLQDEDGGRCGTWTVGRRCSAAGRGRPRRGHPAALRPRSTGVRPGAETSPEGKTLQPLRVAEDPWEAFLNDYLARPAADPAGGGRRRDAERVQRLPRNPGGRRRVAGTQSESDDRPGRPSPAVIGTILLQPPREPPADGRATRRAGAARPAGPAGDGRRPGPAGASYRALVDRLRQQYTPRPRISRWRRSR